MAEECGARLLVELLSGQAQEDFEARTSQLAHTFEAMAGRDPAGTVAAVEAQWLAEVEHRGSGLHDDARCYFQEDRSSSIDGFLEARPANQRSGRRGQPRSARTNRL